MRIRFLDCPNCGRRFYIHEEFAGQGYDWFCPFCGHTFKEPGAVKPLQQRAPSEGGAGADMEPERQPPAM